MREFGPYGLYCEHFSYVIFSDVDECITETHDCDTNALCTNNIGSYNCSCKSGFKGDGKSCQGMLVTKRPQNVILSKSTNSF